MDEIVILEGKRTAFGSFGGSLKKFSSTQLGVLTALAALKAAGIEASDVDEIIFGNVIQSHSNAIYLARHIGLKAGLSEDKPALTVNRLCGSGMEAVVLAARTLMTSQANIILAGGAESMSNAPFVSYQARWGNKFGDMPLEDSLMRGLTDEIPGMPMGLTAEKLAAKYSISRNEQDEYAGLTQVRAENATTEGVLAQEITPVDIPGKYESKIFSQDEYIKGQAGTKNLAKLKPAFKEGGTVTAGNASGLNDGSCALLMARKSWAQ